MKKHFILYLGFALLPCLMPAQSFPSNDATWQSTLSSIIGPVPMRQVLCGDTIINGRQYSRFYDYQNIPGVGDTLFYRLALRNEGDRVWYMDVVSPQERLLYDFGLQAGESITLYYVGLSDEATLQVDSVEIVGQGGDAYRIIHFKPRNGIVESWIQGVGSTLGPVNRGLIAIDALGNLECFRKSGELIYHSIDAVDCDFDYNCSLTALEPSPQKGAGLQLYPTLSQGQLQFVNPHPETIVLLAFNLQGQLIAQYGPFGEGQHRVNANELSPGLYLFQAVEKNKNLSLQHFKIIIAQD